MVHYIADRIAVMRKGRIVEYGEADEVFPPPRVHPGVACRSAAAVGEWKKKEGGGIPVNESHTRYATTVHPAYVIPLF